MRRLFLVVLVAALVPLGCGGSGDDKRTATSGSTTEQTNQSGAGSSETRTDATKGGDKSKKGSGDTKDSGAEAKTTGGETGASGTGGGAAPAEGSTPTKNEFIAKADKVCVEFSKRLSSIPDPGADANATVRLYRKVAKQRAELYRHFAALEKPAGGGHLLAQYESNLKKSVALADQTATALEHNDIQKGPALIEASKTLAEKNERIAEAYGFQSCGG